MKIFVIYDIDRHEKIGEAYDKFMCESMLEMFWEHGIENIQVQMCEITAEGGGE